MAPRDGRIQYRIANIGEVLPAGGKVFTMLDISYVYMDIYLPAPEAGKIKVGTDARILLDAYPNSADSGKSLLPGEPGAIHAENGGNPERTRQADVPDPRADRSRSFARSRAIGAQRIAGGRLSSCGPGGGLAQKSARRAMNERGRPVAVLDNLTQSIR